MSTTLSQRIPEKKKKLIILLTLILICLLCSVLIAQNYRVLNSFNAGQLSELLSAREDLSKYHSGCSIMENFFPLPQGGAQKRPGTVYVAESKNNTKIRMFPFEYSTEQSYAIEAGNQYFRFFTDNAPVWDGVGTADISSLDNIIAHWLLNDDALDTTVLDDDGGTHNGTSSADTSILATTGKIGSCFDLDEQYDVLIADHGDFSFTDDADDSAFSIACWAYITEQSGLQVLLSKWRDESTTKEWRFSLSDDRKLQLHLVDSSTALESDRVAQWELDENAANKTILDTDATSHDGATQTSNTSALTATGISDTCIDFGAVGNDAIVITNDHDELSFGNSTVDSAFSISAWVYVTNTANPQIILSKDDDALAREWNFLLNSNEKLTLYLFDDSAGVHAERTTDDPITIGWHLVVAAYTGQSTTGATAANLITIYVDNQVAPSTATNNANYDAMEDLATKVVIGGSYSNGSLQYYFKDKMDNVILFDVELTSAQISTLWNDGSGTESLAGAVSSPFAQGDDAIALGWHFLTCTYSAPADETTAADGIILYVDGAVVDSTATNDAAYTAMQGGAEEIRIGSQRNTGDTANENFWAEKIDGVAIFDDVLTPTEIASLYSTTPYEIETPYLTADLFEIKYEQSADVLYLCHPDYETRKLARNAEIVWALDAIGIESGPFRTQNTDVADTIAASATTGSVTLTAVGHAPFISGTTSGHLSSGSAATSKSQTGALFKLVHPLDTLAYQETLEDKYSNDSTENTSWVALGTLYKGAKWTLVRLSNIFSVNSLFF